MKLLSNTLEPHEVSDAVRAWAAADPEFAALLASGVTTLQAAARRGLDLLKANRSADAVPVLRLAVTLLPGDPSVWLNLGIALDRTGAPAEAARCLDRALALSHEQPDTWTLLGVVRGRLGDCRGAEAAYRTALQLQPQSVAAWQLLAILKEQERDYAAAIECFRACAALGEASGAVWANLGRLYYQSGSVVEADDAYRAAVRADPSNGHYSHMLFRTQFLRGVLEGASVDDALATYERSSLSRDEKEPDRIALLDAASGLFGQAGHTDAAIRVTKKRLELRPESAAARYLLSALVGEPGIDRSPTDYIVESFDAFAAQFDAKLVGVLGYDVPERLCSVVREATAPGHLYDALDAGCGTGMCGPPLRPLARELTGVDLSSKMLELAACRRVYDALVREELTAFLARNPGRFDLIVAADVLIYFGELARLFALAASAIRPGGLLVFSTELLRGEGYVMRPTGRFAHAPGYVQAAAAPAFLREVCAETTLRLDTHARVPGHLFAFRRTR